MSMLPSLPSSLASSPASEYNIIPKSQFFQTATEQLVALSREEPNFLIKSISGQHLYQINQLLPKKICQNFLAYVLDDLMQFSKGSVDIKTFRRFDLFDDSEYNIRLRPIVDPPTSSTSSSSTTSTSKQPSKPKRGSGNSSSGSSSVPGSRSGSMINHSTTSSHTSVHSHSNSLSSLSNISISSSSSGSEVGQSGINFEAYNPFFTTLLNCCVRTVFHEIFGTQRRFSLKVIRAFVTGIQASSASVLYITPAGAPSAIDACEEGNNEYVNSGQELVDETNCEFVATICIAKSEDFEGKFEMRNTNISKNHEIVPAAGRCFLYIPKVVEIFNQTCSKGSCYCLHLVLGNDRQTHKRFSSRLMIKSFKHIPYGILYKILGYCTDDALYSLALCNTHFYKAVYYGNDSSFWKTLCFRDFNHEYIGEYLAKYSLENPSVDVRKLPWKDKYKVLKLSIIESRKKKKQQEQKSSGRTCVVQ